MNGIMRIMDLLCVGLLISYGKPFRPDEIRQSGVSDGGAGIKLKFLDGQFTTGSTINAKDKAGIYQAMIESDYYCLKHKSNLGTASTVENKPNK